MTAYYKSAMLAILVALILPLALASAASETGKAAKDTAKTKAKLTGDEERFIKEAASGGMMEVVLGKTATEKAANEQVKEFGKRMQTDHDKANDRLKKIAADKGVQIPKELEGEHQRIRDRLMKLSGAEFDREYMEAMVEAHKEDIEKFQRQAEKGKDPELQKFAKDTLPVLKKHLELAQTTQKQIKAGSKSAPAASPKAGSKDVR